MDRKTVGVVLEVIREMREITKSRLVHLLFLIDREAKRKLGKRITGLHFKKGIIGIYSPEMDNILKELWLKGETYREIRETGNGDRVSVICSVEEDSVDWIGEKERKLIKSVLKRYGKLPLGDLIRKVEKTKI